MISVPADPALDIAGVPFPEEPGVVVFRLGSLPHVKGFGDDKKSHLIREVQCFFRSHVVGKPDRIDAHFAKDLQFPRKGRPVERRAQRAEIVMLTDTVQFEMPSVQEESSLRIHRHGSKAHTVFFRIRLSFVYPQSGLQRIQKRVIDIPGTDPLHQITLFYAADHPLCRQQGESLFLSQLPAPLQIWRL